MVVKGLVAFPQVPDVLTTSQGHPVESKTTTLTIGPRGPVPLQDFTFLDDMAHFDRERIPERVVHAKGAGWCCVGCHVIGRPHSMYWLYYVSMPVLCNS